MTVMPATGYGHARYAASLAEWGEPVPLVEAGGWILVRPIPATPYRDAMGPYPLLVCQEWAAVCADIERLPTDIVSLTFVTDPFADLVAAGLHRCLDEVRPFKTHHVADLSVPIGERISRHHRKSAQKALRDLSVEVVDRPVEHLAEWHALYRNIVQRFGLSGMKAFSLRSFEEQLSVPGSVMFRARHGDETVGAQLAYEHGDRAYIHLAGISDGGYAAGASYALDWVTSEWFADRCRWLDFGGAAGNAPADVGPAGLGSASSGLDAYKRGWCTDRLVTALCTKILDRETYASLSARTRSSSGYFPAYRDGELV